MQIISCNVNGVRSAARRNFFAWAVQQDADFICLQEIRATEEQFPPEAFLDKYHLFLNAAIKPGYSGVAIYAKQKPRLAVSRTGHSLLDNEGRFLLLEYESFRIASVYFPSGSSSPVRQEQKYVFMKIFEEMMSTYGKDLIVPTILCGDWNIAHTKMDIKNWKSNEKNSGFLLEERLWLDKVFGSMKFVDAFRIINQQADEYSWWSSRGKARQNNVGWRIDYHVISEGLRPHVTDAKIYREQYFSDHAPVIVHYRI